MESKLPEDNSLKTEAEKEKPVKVKKPKTEAQMAAFRKGLEVLKAKREAIKAEKEKMSEEQKKEKEEERHQKYLKARYEKKSKLPPVPEYVSKNDLENFKKDLFELVNRTTPKTVYQEVPIVKTVEKVVPVAIEVPIEKVNNRVISGSSLLDSIFFK